MALHPELYTYQRLEYEDSIRLLQIRPGEADNPTRYFLISYRLRECPRYTAVSYTWGEPSLRESIVVDGKTFGVGRNLFVMLQDVSLIDCARLLWIDAISINQQDVQERNSQVRIMGSIYAEADDVFAWVGRLDVLNDSSAEDAHSDLSDYLRLEHGRRDSQMIAGDPKPVKYTQEFLGLPQMSQIKRRRGYKAQKALLPRTLGEQVTGTEIAPSGDSSNIPPYPQKVLKLIPAKNLVAEQIHTRGAHALYVFFKSPYWTRRWIVQEIILAKRVTFLWQRKQVAMQEVLDMAQRCLYSADGRSALLAFSHETQTDTKIMMDRIEQIQALLVQHANWRQFGPSEKDPCQRMAELMQQFARYACTNPLDKIYSLLALVRLSKDAVAVNYDFSLEELFVEVLQKSVSQPDLLEYEGLRLARILSKELFHETGKELGLPHLWPSQSVRRHWQITAGVKAVVSEWSVSDIELRKCVKELNRVSHGALHAVQRWRFTAGDAGILEEEVEMRSQRRAISSTERKIGSEELCSGECFFPCQPLDIATRKPVLHSDPSPWRSNRQLVGIASSPVEAKDEIWQFGDIRSSIVMRKTETGYMMVARAALVVVAWDQDDTLPLQYTYTLSTLYSHNPQGIIDGEQTTDRCERLNLSTSILLDLTQWIDLPTEETGLFGHHSWKLAEGETRQEFLRKIGSH